MITTYLMVLLAGCGPSTDTGDSNVVDADTDTDADSDADTDADASFKIAIPMGGATVMVNEVVVPCDASNVCTASADGDGTFEVTVAHPTYYFIPKEVVVTDGVPSTPEVTYATGGCADSGYAGTSWCASGWVMSEYAVNITGEYCDEWDRCATVKTGHGDLDGDGVEDETLDVYGDGSLVFNVSGTVMYGYQDNLQYGHGSMESDLSVLRFSSGGADGNASPEVLTRSGH